MDRDNNLSELISKISMTEYKIDTIIKDLERSGEQQIRIEKSQNDKLINEIALLRDEIKRLSREFDNKISNSQSSLMREIDFINNQMEDLENEIKELKTKDSYIENSLTATEKEKFNKAYSIILAVVMSVITSIITAVVQYFIQSK
jgi:hypothetical protein